MSTQVISRPSSSAVGSDFPFVDNIRFITMCALFVEHTVVAVEATVSNPPVHVAQMTICLVHFGSVAFFLASGFLLGSFLHRQGISSYLKKRLDRIFLPWLCWFSAFCVALVYLNVHHGRTPIILGLNAWSVVLGWIDFAFHTPYWFVPNLLFSLCVLLMVRRLVGEKISGTIWAGASLFYAVNVYLRWLPTSHQNAWLGFVFYLWLGAFCAKHYDALVKFLARIPYSLLFLLVALLWLGSVAEYGLILRLYPQDDPGNSLRITGQVYALGVMSLIAKARTRLSPSFIDIRRETFGLYLLQPLVLYTATVALAKLVHMGLVNGARGTAFHLTLWIVWSALVYFVALAATKALASSSSLRWSIGVAKDKKYRQLVTPFPEPRSASDPVRHRPATGRLPAA